MLFPFGGDYCEYMENDFSIGYEFFYTKISLQFYIVLKNNDFSLTAVVWRISISSLIWRFFH